VSLVGFRAQNHPQQVGRRGAAAKVDDRETPSDLFAALDARFGFTLDVAASASNAKCSKYYTIEDDGLYRPWVDEMVWCNPPYSDIQPWVAKAWAIHEQTRGVVMLLPANRTEQGWWQRFVEPNRDRPDGGLVVEFLAGRLRFIQAGRTDIGPNERPPFGCCLLIWSGK